MAIYISKTTGNWNSASTWLTALPANTYTTNSAMSAIGDAGQPPQSNGGDKIIIRDPTVTVTYNVEGVFGDGTSINNTGPVDPSTTALFLTNAICISAGTLQASRSEVSSLTANGLIVINNNGAKFDWGTTSSPVTVKANIVLGLLSDTSISNPIKNGITLKNGTNPDAGLENSYFYICGNEKTRNTQLNGDHATTATTITVLDSTGWSSKDRIIIENRFITSTSNYIGEIVSVNGNIITITPGLDGNYKSGAYVGNFSSNIEISPGYSTTGGANATGINLVAVGNNSAYEIRNCSFKNWGGGITLRGNTFYARRNIIIDKISNDSILNGNTFISWSGGVGYQHTISNFAIYSPTGSGCILQSGGGLYFNNGVVYRVGTAFTPNQQSPAELDIKNTRTFSTSYTFGAAVQCYKINVYDSNFRSQGASSHTLRFGPVFGKVYLQNCYIETNKNNPATIINSSESSDGIVEARNCTLSACIPSIDGLRTSKGFVANFYSINDVTTSNKRFNSFYSLSGNYTNRNRGIASYEWVSLIANQQYYIKETIPTKANVSQRFVGYLKFDVLYGPNTLPYVTFTDASNNSSVTQTFNCSFVPNVWQKFDLTVNPIADGNLTMTVYSQTSSTTAKIYLDGLSFDPINPKSRHYGFQFNETFPNQTIDASTTLTENQVATLANINNLDYLYDASNYWSVTNPSSISYVDLYSKDGKTLDFGSKHIVVDNSASNGFAYSSNVITLKTPLLSGGVNFNGLRTTGNVYLSSESSIGNINIYANVYQASAVSLTGVTMQGTLAYKTEDPTTIEYTNCSMDTVQNDGNAIITIKKTNSTITNGADLQIADFIPTVLNLTLNGGYIAIYDNSGTRQYYQNTDGAVILPSSATGTWTYRIARYGYQYIQGSFVVNPDTGANVTISPTYTPDNFVTSNPTTVAAYTDLETTEKIYNYLNYWSTTSTGINYTPFYSKAFGSITINKNVNLDKTAASILVYNGSTLLTLKCTGLSEDTLFVSDGNIVAQNGTTYSDDVKIRAANLNSELILGGITSMTLYPSEAARDANTTPGDVLTGTIYRFLYGSTVNGVTLSGTIYARVNVSGTILLYSDAITSGRNELEFGTTGTLQQIINNQKVINAGVQKASKLIPHSTNI